MLFRRTNKQAAQGETIEHDLAVLQAMTAEIEDYLKADILFWQLSPERSISPAPPLLTIGGYLLRAQRLGGLASELDREQREQLRAAEDSYRLATTAWRVRTGQHIQRELKARLDSWQWFVEDCLARKSSCVDYYATEAEVRTIVALLLRAGEQVDLSPHIERLGQLDQGFRTWFKAGEFIWRASLQASFPVDEFWWLYGRPEFPTRK